MEEPPSLKSCNINKTTRKVVSKKENRKWKIVTQVSYIYIYIYKTHTHSIHEFHQIRVENEDVYSPHHPLLVVI